MKAIIKYFIDLYADILEYLDSKGLQVSDDAQRIAGAGLAFLGVMFFMILDILLALLITFVPAIKFLLVFLCIIVLIATCIFFFVMFGLIFEKLDWY